MDIMGKLENKTKEILKKIKDEEAEFIMQLSAANVITDQIGEFNNIDILIKLKEDIEIRLRKFEIMEKCQEAVQKELFDKFDKYSCIKKDKWYLELKSGVTKK